MHNILLNRILILLTCAFILGSPQSIIELAVELATVTPTSTSNSATPTATAGTPLPSFTPTSTSQSATFTATAGTPLPTFTPSATPSLTATTTLMPLPEITLNFPQPTSTPIPSKTQLAVYHTPITNPPGEDEELTISPRIKFLSFVLVILWLVLAGFLVVYIRQLK